MADRKVLLNEIALLTNLLGHESPAAGAEVAPKKVSPKRKLIVRPRPANKFRIKRGPDLIHFHPGKVLSVLNNVAATASQAPIKQQTEVAGNGQVIGYPGFISAAQVLKAQSSRNRSLSAYKVDRRVKKSPVRSAVASSTNYVSVRKNSATKLASLLSLNSFKKSPKRNVLLPSSTSPFRKYSIRKYSIRKIKPSSSVSAISTESLSPRNNGKILPSYLNPANSAKGSNRVVRIEGTKFLSRNAGKSLKRISFSFPGLSNFQSLSKPKTPGHRSANRVLQRSITTLGGGSKKSRICYFLSNFGRCKRKENSMCPFFHGLPDVKKQPKKLVKCKYFRKGECLRPKCQYVHEKDPIGRHRQLHWNRRVKSSIGRKIRKKLATEDETKNPTARYYLTEPDANPLNAIITRRLPKGVEIETVTPSSPCPSSSSKSSTTSEVEDDPEIEIIFDSNCDRSNDDQMVSTKDLFCIDRGEDEVPATKTTTPPPMEDIRRQRLLNKVTSLKERLGRGKEMPIYLPFVSESEPGTQNP